MDDFPDPDEFEAPSHIEMLEHILMELKDEEDVNPSKEGRSALLRLGQCISFLRQKEALDG